MGRLPLPENGIESALAAVQGVQGGMPFSVELTRKKNKLLSPKYMRVYKIATLCLIITGVGFYHEMEADPAVNIPTPVMPKPNAYDYFREGGSMASALKKESKDASDMDADLRETPLHPPKFSPLERVATLAQFEPALTRMRQGFQFPFQNPPVRSASQLLPEFADFRNLARILTLEADVCEDQADWNGAISSRLDSLYLGREVPKGGSLIAGLVGVAIQAIGRANAQPIIENLSAGEARNAVKRMESILADQTPYAQILREEKWAMQASLAEIFRMPRWRSEALKSLTGGGVTGSPLDSLRLLFINKRASMKNLSNYMDALITEAELPYQKGREAPPVPNDAICQIFCPAFEQAGFRFVQNQVENRFTLTALALQAYRAERKKYPESLARLVKEGYLSELPKDPFNLNQPLKYLNKGGAYLLYSVGPDGKDDNGKPAEDPDFRKQLPTQKNGKPKWGEKEMRQLRRIVPLSEGDAVYLTNTR